MTLYVFLLAFYINKNCIYSFQCVNYVYSRIIQAEPYS